MIYGKEFLVKDIFLMGKGAQALPHPLFKTMIKIFWNPNGRNGPRLWGLRFLPTLFQALCATTLLYLIIIKRIMVKRFPTSFYQFTGTTKKC